jgi:hypothetical protein
MRGYCTWSLLWCSGIALGDTGLLPSAVDGMDSGGKNKRRRKPPAVEAVRETRVDGWVRAAPGHPWLDPTRPTGRALAVRITSDRAEVVLRKVIVGIKEAKRANHSLLITSCLR